MSFFYEGDVNKLGGGILIEKRLKKHLFSSEFNCDLVINKKTYPCRIYVPIYGGYAVKDIYKSKDELLNYVFEQLKNSNGFLVHFITRWVVKFLLRLAFIFAPIYTIYMYKYIPPQKLIFAIISLILIEIITFIANGVLNKL